MKTLVTHLSLDLDAIASCWLIVRFLPEWNSPEFKFVPAGTTLSNALPDSDQDIIHVDTGYGMFDHHQTTERTTATRLVFSYLAKKGYFQSKNIEPLERMVTVINELDHFGEVQYPNAAEDHYDFMIHQVIEGMKAVLKTEKDIMEYTFKLLDAVFQIFKNKVRAVETIKKGYIFQSRWGKSLAIESKNEEALKVALKSGFSFVVKKDPERGFARIKTLPDAKLDLTPLYDKIVALDKKGTWFLHISKHMLLNSSSKNPNFVPTPLSLPKLIDIIKKIE
ncbi:MAG: hypothetical protein US11_C0004G0062 [Candidatus Roizmanbacteria bacterium GW2011_GWA2_36_23]|uniref:ChrB C-terminal domain-containing protein n=1 Tax=Candidatus Roizmanbacteria bacterium GW2011_GWA2_36_23 TaxID=1618480 RepID=A0A0G0E8D2_9BACT|nr:MAG: hypothetical protein US11_C0004G0062 [Candidatus Roizmanbacteria bacterium GW2011_GWA2_36_23]